MELDLDVERGQVAADLWVPPDARGLVVFVHGSGSSRLSPRNQNVAEVLREENLATLLVDLLTEEEAREDMATHEIRFDIPFIGQRVVQILDWVSHNDKTAHLSLGLIGSSTGAAAALVAAAQCHDVAAVVSRGGRPDLAGAHLTKVNAPTLLIVGSLDTVVIELNERAFELLSCEKRLEIVEGASHLFEETGTLEQASTIAKNWFVQHLT